MAPLDSRYTQVGFNLISAQVCLPRIQRYHRNILYKSLEMSPQLFISVDYLAMHPLGLASGLYQVCTRAGPALCFGSVFGPSP